MSDADPTCFTLHVADRNDVARLGRTMGNCLASYGRERTSGAHRIIEVRDGGRTQYAIHVHAGRIAMFEASNNRAPDPRDVPIVRTLLEWSGILDATRTAAEAEQHRAKGRPPGLSVQDLAAQLLRPYQLGQPEWPEFAAALWATGILPTLPDPDRPAFEQIVLDLAQRIATGQDHGLPRAPARSDEERRGAAQDLRRERHPTTWAAWQRHRMADVLVADLRP